MSGRVRGDGPPQARVERPDQAPLRRAAGPSGVGGERRGRALVVPTLVVAGLLHVVPGVALLLPERLGSLYGVLAVDSGELVLLRHRALLLAILGALLLVAVVRPLLTVTALVAALVSTVVFVLLALEAGGPPELLRVALVDAVLLPFLVGALVIARRPAGGAPPLRRR